MEYVNGAIVGLLGLVMIWIGIFGGKISYSSRGAIPQIREFIAMRKQQKQVERDVQEMLKDGMLPIGIIFPDEAERFRKEAQEHINKFLN